MSQTLRTRIGRADCAVAQERIAAGRIAPRQSLGAGLESRRSHLSFLG